MDTLIVIDVQNDFIPGGSLAVPFGNEIIKPLNKLLDKFELIVATQDWHPANHMSFASNYEGKKPFDIIELGGIKQTLWPGHCIQNTWGAQFHPEFDTSRIEAIFRKGMDPCIDSYSGFYDNGHKKSTGLSGYLKEKGAEKLFFCGLAADICVYYSIKDALSDGFSATLIEEASRPLDINHYMKIKNELNSLGAAII